MHRRDVAIAATLAVLVSTTAMLPVFDGWRASSIDVLFRLRQLAFGPLHPPETSPAVVIALDEESFRREPLADMPQALWPKYIAPVLTRVIDGGAAVVGCD